MTPEQTVELILGVAGVILQLVYAYVPVVRDWLENYSYKGLVILGLDAVVAGALLALACSPWAVDLGIPLVCGNAAVFLILKALVLIATQQGAYLVTRKSK